MGRGSCGPAAEAGEVPGAVAGADQIDGRGIDDELGDAHLAMEEQRAEFNADVERFGLDKGRGAEGWVVGDGDVFGDQAAAEERKTQVAEGDLAAEGAGKLVLDCRPECIGVDEEGSDDNNEDGQDNGSDRDFDPALLNGSLLGEDRPAQILKPCGSGGHGSNCDG